MKWSDFVREVNGLRTTRRERAAAAARHAERNSEDKMGRAKSPTGTPIVYRPFGK